MDSPTAYQSAKFGMWLFLATEVLLFGGLFAAFAIFRFLYLDAFIEGCKNLNVWAGAINTAVLLGSSLTAALAVDAAQRGQNDKLKNYLLITIGCGFIFLIIKYLEYSSKVSHGIFPGDFAQVLFFGGALIVVAFLLALAFEAFHYKEKSKYHALVLITLAFVVLYFVLNYLIFLGPPAHSPGGHEQVWGTAEFNNQFKMFYGLYYCMTGLHALHVIIGMAIIFWVYRLAQRNRFSENYYGPVEISALYWHLVDLIWIYLFPLLYLVGR
jgi:cytochrome c oxidase subunit 3